KVDVGKREYDSKCAVCHGVKGKGDGPYQGLGSQVIPDLTTLARKNGGVFPFQKTYEIIDGRTELKAHGTRDMPIWGTEYRHDARGAVLEADPPEAVVRARILALNEYLYRMQVK
ncbi:MAG: c-type cytochrome, partial [Usitatibacter sp.]